MLLHADLGTHHQWDEVRAGLKHIYPTVAFDRRGHSASDIPGDGDFSSASSASDISAVADRFGIDRFALIGHSGGALLAWSCAATQPRRIAGVLLVDPPLDASTFPPGTIDQTLKAVRGPDFIRAVDDFYRSIAGTNPMVIERVVEEARETPQATVVGCFEALRDFNRGLLAGQYARPMLSVIQPQYDVEGALHRFPPGWPHKSISGTGHWIQLDARKTFLEHAKAFLDGLQPQGVA